jgi:hypothetical protein
LGLWAIALLIVCPPPAMRAADAQKSITAARDALNHASFPWYDGTKDGLRALALRPEREPWRLPHFSLNWVAWVVLVVLGLALIAVAFLLLRSIRAGRSRSAALERSELLLHADAVEALPFMADRSRGDLLAEARRHYQQGNYNEAIIYLFSYELVRLDKSALIQLAKGKTNRQYLRETSHAQPIRRLLELTMVTFEDVFFGRRGLDRGGFEACWNRLDEFERLLAEAAT